MRFKRIAFTKGLVFFLAASLLTVSLAIVAVDHWNYSDRALFLARLLSIVVIAGLAGWLMRPLLRKIEDVQVARYIEEKHPELQDRLVSAIELGRKEAVGPNSLAANPIVPLLIQDANKRTRSIQTRSLFSPKEPFLSGAIAFGLILFFVLFEIFGPDFFHYSTLKLFANWLIPQTESIYRLEVNPGNIQVRRGSDQLISVQLSGFDSHEVHIFSRYESTGTREKSRMESQKGSNAFGFLFLDINEKIQYYVQAGNVKSPEFTISVADVAQVEKVNLTYHFPRYTGLPARKEEEGGEISAIKGTRVDVEVTANIAVASARILLDDGSSLSMESSGDRRHKGRIEVRKNSSYKIELTDFAQHAAVGSHEYLITALEDQPPFISVLKPGRDKKVTKLEEVLTEVKADDDFGITSMELHFTVNGGKENVVDLFKQEAGEVPKSISGTHTFFLEEYDLEPGDFISFFAKASDARIISSSDIYFLEVRPFGKEYSQAQSTGGMGGAGDVGSVLSARQKEILAATWRLIRDSKTFDKKAYSENLQLVASAQQKLQQQTKSLSDRMQRRALVSRDKEFQKLSDNLIKAIEAMTPAYQLLSEKKPKQAVSPEQTALQHLMRAEAYFKEIQVAFGANAGGQGNAASAEELEGLFELELDKLKNQYETVQQRNSMQAGAEVDEATQKLKELARRQQQLNERRRQGPTSRFSQGGGGGGSDQQMLQEEAEKLARQLERLSRETQNEDLLRASQQLRQAAQEMRNASRNASGNDSQNRGLQALSRLGDAQELLENHQRSSVADDLKRMQASAEELARKQARIQSQVEELSRNPSERGSAGSELSNPTEQIEKEFQQKRKIFQDKTQLKKGLDIMEQSFFASAKKAGAQQKSTSEKLQGAGNAIRDSRIQERVDQGGQLIARGMYDAAKQREQNIQGMIEDLKQRIASAQKSLKSAKEGTSEERLSRALSQTGDLLGNLESLSRRIQQLQGTQNQKENESPGQDSRSQKNSRSERGKPLDGRDLSQSQEVAGRDGGDAKDQSGKPTQSGQASDEADPINTQGEPTRQQGNRQSGQSATNQGKQALGGSNDPNGQTHSDAADDSEQQHHGSTSRGMAAVNFGDRELPSPGKLTPEQMRQFQKEYELRFEEAQEIGKNLRVHRDLGAQLKNMVERMKQMDSMKFLHDSQELDRLQSHVIGGFRQLELELSKNLQHFITKENLHLAKDEDIPEAYRGQVEDYYKALSAR